MKKLASTVNHIFFSPDNTNKLKSRLLSCIVKELKSNTLTRKYSCEGNYGTCFRSGCYSKAAWNHRPKHLQTWSGSLRANLEKCSNCVPEDTRSGDLCHATGCIHCPAGCTTGRSQQHSIYLHFSWGGGFCNRKPLQALISTVRWVLEQSEMQYRSRKILLIQKNRKSSLSSVLVWLLHD